MTSNDTAVIPIFLGSSESVLAYTKGPKQRQIEPVGKAPPESLPSESAKEKWHYYILCYNLYYKTEWVGQVDHMFLYFYAAYKKKKEIFKKDLTYNNSINAT